MKTSLKKLALITGASSGIGREFAVRFARMGYDLIITGRNKEKLTELANELKTSFGTKVNFWLAELSSNRETGKLARAIAKRDDIYVLVNNAGYGSGVDFLKNQIDKNLQMLQVHVVASLKFIHAVLPQMIRRKEGVIINVSSLGAYTPARGATMYSATKIFLKSFTESLSIELAHQGIMIQCLCPGFTRTRFHERRENSKGLKSGKLLWMDPAKVVDKSLRSLQKGCIICIPGLLNKIIACVAQGLPRRLYYRMMRKSGDVKVAPGSVNGGKQFIKKAIPLLLAAKTDKVRLFN